MMYAEVGEAAGMSGVVAGQWLAGIRQPSLGAAAALAAVVVGGRMDVRFTD